ncbi:MAG: hypothetical protein ACRDRJ_38515 [Streptosporangiaceae bacterium]
MLAVSRRQALAGRMEAHHLSERLPAGSHVEAARFGLQDSAPRDALLGMHARMEACAPDSWQDPRLIQTYSPRAAVYLLPREDSGVFTIGRLPLDPAARHEIECTAEDACRELNGREVRGAPRPGHRRACASGRIAVRWTTRTGRFVGPGLNRHTPAQDWFHPNGVLADGHIVGAWGRRGGRVSVKVTDRLPARTRQAIEAEALSFPVAGASVDVVEA